MGDHTQMRTMVLEYGMLDLLYECPSFVGKYSLHGAYGKVIHVITCLVVYLALWKKYESVS